tara:strand:+ start:468 stop:857 length:390 start_codon:yes stop_codon:yes gene_type:complete
MTFDIQLPNELWMYIFNIRGDIKKRAAKIIVKRIENYVYYYLFRSPFSFEITRKICEVKSSQYLDFLLTKPGIRFEFKHDNYHWAEELNKANNYIFVFLQDLEMEFQSNNLWETYLPINYSSTLLTEFN